ncbi:MAG: hypothetical protein Kow0075_16710 [Salibacteraceae bacterium]
MDVLFQPAEETGEGAHAVLSDQQFDISRYTAAIALHNIPGAPMHQIITRVGNFTPAVHSIIFRLHGKTAHAAQPLTGHNPAYAIGQIIEWARTNEQVNEEADHFLLITPVYVTVGSKDYGISAGYGEVHFTMRAWQQEELDAATDKLISAVNKISQKHQLSVENELLAEFRANVNDQVVVNKIIEAANTLGMDHTHRDRPFPWGEDFGIFTQSLPGAMFGLGSGENTPALHNPDYDFPDEIIETGASVFYQTCSNLLKTTGDV